MHQHDPAPSPVRAPRRRRHPLRSGLTVGLGALALLASACGSSDSGPASSASEQPQHDTAALDAGSSWLASQVTKGVVHNDQYSLDDYGLSVDVALALHGVGAEDATVRAISDRLASHVDDYTAPGYGTVTSAGSTAKAVVLAQAVGADPTSYGGKDLVAQLEDTVADHGPAAGRIQDAIDPHVKSAADYANVIGQAYAVRALDAAGSDEAGAATDYLLAQQCSGGWFRLDFAAADDAHQACDDAKSSKPDLDATAFAVQALSGDDSSQVASHVDAAVAWLTKQQAPDGSFGGGSGSTTPNSNSTGLAGTVLAGEGETSVAEKAAAWVSAHQVADCADAEQADVGAIAYDDTAQQAVATKGITVKTSDQFRRATAQALPVLQWLRSDETGTAGSC